MPVIRSNHLKRAHFEQGMADNSATSMARTIHEKLAGLHTAEADARYIKSLQPGAKH